VSRSGDAVISNAEMARIFSEIGDMLEILGEVVYKAVAYRRVADAVERYPDDVAALFRRGTPPKLPGAGEALTAKLAELAESGSLEYHGRLRAQVPDGLLEILRIPGVGPKTVRLISTELGIDSVEALRAAAEHGRLRSLKGLSARTETNVLEAIGRIERQGSRQLIHDADALVAGLVERLRDVRGVRRIEPAGSLRRRRPTIGDLDLLAAVDDPAAVIAALDGLPEVEAVVSAGTDKSTIILADGPRVDLMVCVPAAWGTHLVHFTGSKDHNVAMRGRAQRMGFKIHEYGLFHGDELIVCKDEAELFRKLGLDYVPPELREDLGEVQAAEDQTLPPSLVEWSDLRGALHVHSRASCGAASVPELLSAAETLGWSWLGIADVTQGVDAVAGLRAEDVPAYLAELRTMAEAARSVRLFCGITVRIDAQGKLDLPMDLLRLFDYVVAGVHDAFDLDRAQQTQRLVTSLQCGVVTVLAHPLSRLLGSREAMDMDFAAVVAAAVDNNVLLEINGDPERMDLDGQHTKQGRDRGARFVVEPAARTVEELRRSGHALGMARRGWLSTEHVANTDSAEAVDAWMQGKEPLA
jgi:DNA polymerase (family 10)